MSRGKKKEKAEEEERISWKPEIIVVAPPPISTKEVKKDGPTWGLFHSKIGFNAAYTTPCSDSLFLGAPKAERLPDPSP